MLTATVTETNFSLHLLFIYLFYFFFQLEKEKQHDIRSFFSPGVGKEKKRKRTDDEEASPTISTQTTAATTDAPSDKQEQEKESQASMSPDSDFSPQVKRLRTPQPSSSPSSRFQGKPRSKIRSVDSGSPQTPVFLKTPRRLVESEPPAEAWSCGACTFSNSSLLPYCEMCEHPRSTPAARSGGILNRAITHHPIIHPTLCLCACPPSSPTNYPFINSHTSSCRNQIGCY